MSNQRIKKYFVPPPFVTTLFTYQDLNKDEKIKMTITNFIHKKLKKYFEKKIGKNGKISRFLESEKGYVYIFELIHEFLNYYNYQWVHFNYYYYQFKSFAINRLYEKF